MTFRRKNTCNNFTSFPSFLKSNYLPVTQCKMNTLYQVLYIFIQSLLFIHQSFLGGMLSLPYVTLLPSSWVPLLNHPFLALSSHRNG